MKLRKSILVIGTFLIFITGCNKEWDSHYNTFPETVDQHVWEAMQGDSQISQVVQVVKDYQLDTLFNSDISYTIFAPTNEALSSYGSAEEVFTDVIIKYHISSHYINTSNIDEKRKVQTLTEKFAL